MGIVPYLSCSDLGCKGSTRFLCAGEDERLVAKHAVLHRLPCADGKGADKVFRIIWDKDDMI